MTVTSWAPATAGKYPNPELPQLEYGIGGASGRLETTRSGAGAPTIRAARGDSRARAETAAVTHLSLSTHL